ncbi:outer membrane protein assembly factor BamD [Robertkochia marina]|uniref:Outer membrane protein assembly factor BamD n=1 Tax=Robertkochia marina TaxID=1227945 RepID=A0A4S3M0U3_9FLAO|nr:outer membrane protein assembly factor BamD [Robertkochia marina]THD68052.1 outer membrane protein assembly factor BamD [Robertkochia marina]TRZ42664.1 outer membrane protein assembly factor BamD [Robertkochia marina]
MIKKYRTLLTGVLATVLLSSCSEYQKVLKEDDVKKKYEMAEKLYSEGDYTRAIRLFDQIVPNYIGKPQGERIIYFYADSYYQKEQYYQSAYQFERFAKSYPRSEKVEQAAFLGAKSEYLTSPKYSLDQAETKEAIERLQVYINSYPESEKLEEANAMVQDLRRKLDKKSFEIAKQYNTISDYFASIKSFELFLKDNPGSEYREDALFYKFTAEYNLAMNSIYSKREERLNNAIETYNVLLEDYAEGQYREDAEDMLTDINKELEQFSK